MKIRTSFVSNSSSSSFVVVGIRIPEKKFNEMGGCEFFEDKFEYVDFPEGEDEAILGKRIGRWSEGEGEVGVISFEEVVKMREEVSIAVNELFPDGEYNMELIYGESYG